MTNFDQPSAAALRSVPDGAALSVVVIAFTGQERLERCLATLEHQVGVSELEILVPHDASLDAAGALAARFPRVCFVAFDGLRPPAELRARGVERARGRIVALLEDHCIPDRDWAARVIAAHERNVVAVGGAVEKGMPAGARTDTALNWALYIGDYSRYMTPLPEGPTHSVTDCNSSYKRSALEAVRAAWPVEFHENLVNAALRGRGGALWIDASIVVRQQRSLTWRAALRDRFTFGRLFGATRVETLPATRRLALAATAPALPPLLVARAAGNLLARGRHLGALLRALPALTVVSTAWALGEVTGYLTARPGAALAPRGTGPVTGVVLEERS